jgi:hypothetical protein
MENVVEMGSGAMIYIPSSIKIDSKHSEVNRGIHRPTDSEESRLKIRKDK